MIGTAVMSMLMAAPAVFAAEDEVVVFGGDFEEPPAVEQPVEQPDEEPPPADPQLFNEQPSNVESRPSGNRSSQAQPADPRPVERPVDPQLFNEQPSNVESRPSGSRSSQAQPADPQPVERPFEPQLLNEPPTNVDSQPDTRRSGQTQPVEDDYIDVGKTIRFNQMPTDNQPIDSEDQPGKIEPTNPQPVEPIPVEPRDVEVVDPEHVERELREPFKDLMPNEPVTFEPHVDQPQPAVEQPYQRYDQPSTDNTNVKPVEPTQPATSSVQKKGKKLKPRFVKLTSDDTFDYYLDSASVQWQNVPYSTSEYMADVWIRMLERQDSTADLPSDLRDYINDQSNDEIAAAEAKGLIYDPIDVKVLRTKKYFLEHYYIRPQRRQIQFLCELEVVGRPQNAISERAYDYKNWENLIPGSVETAIYYGVLDVIGKGKASSRGHMTVTDMLEEYARISIR